MGGDYHGIDENLCGSWTDKEKGHHIGVCIDEKDFHNKVKDWESYKEIFPKFKEEW